ncbi:MAG: hypothetical protein IT230_12260 [Flavobacteriales bacterium]|nr:hypothetical protein [Flavobacteriales bacterium]
MKSLIVPPVVAFTLLMSSCGDGKADAVKQMAAVADSIKAASTIKLAEHHLPLSVQVPVGLPAATVLWKDEVGKLSVRAGDHFALEIYEAPADMDRLKADLDRDLLKKNTILEDKPELLIYRSEFPDDSTLVFHHFNRSIAVGDRTFQVEDLREGEPFSLQDIRRMAAAVQGEKPL